VTNRVVKKIAILGSGEMGSAIAKCLVDNGLAVITCLADRSVRSQQLAGGAGMQDMGNMQALVAAADIFLSILPPASALAFAEQTCALIRESANDVLFVDCNAISPATAKQIESVAAAAGVRFQDAGIIGAAPRAGRLPVRFYTSGEWLDEIQQLAAELIEIKPLGDMVGRASAIKMVYASLTKGTHALRAAAMMAGEQLGVGEDIRKEWAHSLPDAYRAMESRIPTLAPVSGRWSGEMREIAATYADLDITPAFHEGAEWIYELLSRTELAGESRAEALKSGRDIEETLRHFVAALARA
jgi:3-hydroxyisobutyrate dehydrogenase-like beta-hydroxyacid dehydrogenase